jgi:hypothetical protein
MFFDKGDFRRSDFTYGVTKDQNVESLFSEFFLVFRRSDFRSSDHFPR